MLGAGHFTGDGDDQIEKGSQHSIDSAIDLGEVEMCAVEETGEPTESITAQTPARTLSDQNRMQINSVSR